MIIKELRDEDFVNYKKPSMFIAFPSCSWKCERECGMRVCQNSALATAPNIEIDPKLIIQRYENNPITKAIVFGGLEPFDSWEDVLWLVHEIRTGYYIYDDIIIYTGYKYEEIQDKIQILSLYPNIVVKFGRFVPNQQKHYDEVLGVYLASDNQKAERVS